MRPRTIATAFGACTLALYSVLSAPVLTSMPAHPTAWWIVFVVLFELMAASVAFEVAELVWGICLPAVRHPCAREVPPDSVRVAVLYLCCDDVDDIALAGLHQFRDFDVFILDDSIDPQCRERVDRTGLRVVRRGRRTGFKAGNLNHWLFRWGKLYEYFVILDSDSLMSSQAVWQLVAYLEHPANRDVAAAQSMVLSRPGNLFQQTVGAWTAMRRRILCRLHERIGWSLSQGHNIVHRTRAVLGEGGFDLAASCEDTLVSLNLVRSGWRILTVDVVSHDAEPSNALRYRRRHLRWAGQTVEAIASVRGALPLGLVFLMIRHVLCYLRPACCILLLGVAIQLAPQIGVRDAWQGMLADLRFAPGHALSGGILYVAMATFGALAILQLAHGLCSGIGGRRFLAAFMLGGAMVSFCGLLVPMTMLRSMLGRPVDFTPTQSTAQRTPSGSELVKVIVAPWLIYVGLAIRMCLNPGLLATGFSALWVLILVGYPLVLWAFHLDQRGAGSEVPL